MTDLEQAISIIKNTPGDPITTYQSLDAPRRIAINREAKRLGVSTEEFVLKIKSPSE